MKSLYEELGGTYHQEGDYLIPDLAAPPSSHIGIWGLRRKNYLLKNREPIYTAIVPYHLNLSHRARTNNPLRLRFIPHTFLIALVLQSFAVPPQSLSAILPPREG